jgi:hypothetical protein
MKIPAPNQITQILNAISEGDQQAMDRLFLLVYVCAHAVSVALYLGFQPGTTRSHRGSAKIHQYRLLFLPCSGKAGIHIFYPHHFRHWPPP